MDNAQTIDTIVKDVSLPRKIWNKGKYALIALGAAYILNGGYHLIQAVRYNVNFKEQERVILIGAIYLTRMIESGREDVDDMAKKLKEYDKRVETLTQRNYHLYKALNPFC